jgi:Ca2+-dependent lipid-binding protein
MKFIAESVSQQGQVRALNSTFSKATDISWANTTFAAAWAGFLREWVNKKVQTSLCEKLEQQRPVVLDKIQIADFALSKRPPAASAIRVIRSESQADGNNVVELAISSSGVGFSFLVDAKLKLGIPFKIAVNFEAANLEARVSIVFIRHAPFAKCIRLSLADVPKTSLQIKPEGLSGIDVADLPGIDIWIRSAIEKATVTQVLEPNALYYDSEKHWNNRKRDK